MSQSPTPARQRLRTHLLCKSRKPLETRLKALYAIGEDRAAAGRPVASLLVFHNPERSPDVSEVYVPFRKWLEPLDLPAVEKSLTNDVLSKEENEYVRRLADGVLS